MNSQWWSQIRAGTFDVSNLQSSKLIRDPSEPAWYNLVLDPVDLDLEADEGQCTVEFRCQDNENPGWKRGMDYDFVQVKKIS